MMVEFLPEILLLNFLWRSLDRPMCGVYWRLLRVMMWLLRWLARASLPRLHLRAGMRAGGRLLVPA